VRSGVGEKRYRTENAILRDTARLLAPVRDADVRLETVSAVRERFESQLRSSAFEAMTQTLSRRRHRLHDAAHESDEWHKAVFALRSARARYAAWPVDEDSARAHGMAVIPHAFDSVAGGLSATYVRGRQEMAEAGRRPTADNFHAWRKRAKYLRHQLEILSPVFPEIVGGYASSLSRLGDLLGDEHDLAELLRAVAARPDLCPDPIERSARGCTPIRQTDSRDGSGSTGRRGMRPCPSASSISPASLERDEHHGRFDGQHLGG
jgi:CHAD domain-containing protein